MGRTKTIASETARSAHGPSPAPIREGAAVFCGVGGSGVASRRHEVFYNPEMRHQRDVFIAVLSSFTRFPDRSLTVGLPLEAGGVRAVRLALECDLPLRIFANDNDPAAVAAMQENLARNKVSANVTLSQSDANSFFASCDGFDVIDIDPFGGPGPFLDAAIRRLSRGGLLCVTATDSAALCGVFADVCLRRYWARPSSDPCMHEWAVRILVRYCQLIGAAQDKALVPVLCYKRDHYVRLYLQCRKSKEQSSEIVAGHDEICVDPKSGAMIAPGAAGAVRVGPMYLGPLVDPSAFDAKKFRSIMDDSFSARLFAAGPNCIGYYTIPHLCSLHKVAVQPSVPAVLDALRAAGFFAYESLDLVESIKTDCPYDAFVAVLHTTGRIRTRNLSKKEK